MGLSQRAYAKHRKTLGLSGGTPRAVVKALQAGRITAGPDGLIDPATADAAWERNTSRAAVPPARPSPAPARADAAPVVARLDEVVAGVLQDTADIIRPALPSVVEGAAAALREFGRDATPGALGEALDLVAGLDGGALEIACELIEAAEDGQPLEPLARDLGRRAACSAIQAASHERKSHK